MQLALAQQRGAKLERPPMELQIPELVQLMEKFQAMKAEHAAKHEANFEKKLKKMDEIVKAIQAAAAKSSTLAKVEIPGMKELLGLMADLKKLQIEHAKHEATEDDDEPCNYKLTGRRDQRGLIDLEHGLTFTVIK
jgi:hypothetical protein